MSNARLVLILLICVSPAILLFDGPIVHGLVAGAAALGLSIICWSLRPGETEFFLSFARRAALLAAVPALWMLFQMLPTGLFVHPIWTSAEAAIGYPIRGAITIDIGASVLALGQYLTIVAIAFWSAAVAVDRQRAEWILFALMTATALIGLAMVANTFLTLVPGNALFVRMQAIDCVAMGLVFAAAAGIRTLERYETRHASPDRSVLVLLRTFAACLAAFTLCTIALVLEEQDATLVAAGCGVMTLGAVVCIRRLGLRPWAIGAIAVLVIGTAALLVAGNRDLRTKGVTLAFATVSPPSLTLVGQRLLDDVPLTGTGAGTFAAIASVYRDIDDRTALATAPTAAAEVAIELGRPMLWFIVATMASAIYVLLRASLRRGRDSFYPMAGAGCLITLLLLCFMNAGALGTAAAIIAATTLGLAVAQSTSRTAQQ